MELLPDVRQAFGENLVNEGIIGLEDVDPEAPRESPGYERPDPDALFWIFSERNAPIDAVNECSMWLFRDEQEDTRPWEDDKPFDWGDRLDRGPDLASGELPKYTPPQPYIAPPKIGRNEPCSCGSGRKYKKCCGKYRLATPNSQPKQFTLAADPRR